MPHRNVACPEAYWSYSRQHELCRRENFLSIVRTPWNSKASRLMRRVLTPMRRCVLTPNQFIPASKYQRNRFTSPGKIYSYRSPATADGHTQCVDVHLLYLDNTEEDERWEQTRKKMRSYKRLVKVLRAYHTPAHSLHVLARYPGFVLHSFTYQHTAL